MNNKNPFIFSLLILFNICASSGVIAEEKKVLGKTVLFENEEYEASMPRRFCILVDEIKVLAKSELYLKKLKILSKENEKETILFQESVSTNASTKWRKLKKPRCIQNTIVFGHSKSLTAGMVVFGRKTS